MGRFEYINLLPANDYVYLLKDSKSVMMSLVIIIVLYILYIANKNAMKRYVTENYEKNNCDPLAIFLMSQVDGDITTLKAMRKCVQRNSTTFNITPAMDILTKTLSDMDTNIRKRYESLDFGVLNPLKAWLDEQKSKAVYVLMLFQRIMIGVHDIIEKISASLVVFMYTCISLFNISIQSIKFVEKFLLVVMIIMIIIAVYMASYIISAAITALAGLVTIPLGVALMAASLIPLAFFIILMVFIGVVNEARIVSGDIYEIIQRDTKELEKFSVTN